jgi:hypothetical protein
VNPNAILIGDLVEVKVGGDVFQATVRSKAPKVAGIDPLDPILFEARYCSYSSVLRLVERPAGEEVAA